MNDETPGANVAGALAFLDTALGAPSEAPAAPAPADPAVAAQTPATPAPAPAADPVAAEPAAPAPAEPEVGSLAALIRQQREERQARAAAAREAQDYKARLAEAEAKLAKTSKTDLLADPIGFAAAHGLSEQEMALVGQAYLYHLVPDRAPVDLRIKLMEARQAREKAAERRAQEEQARTAAAQAEAQQLQQYQAAMIVAAQTWEGSGAHPFPESGAWFGGNHGEYAESLVHTARNLAEVAASRGEMADLSPKAVAAALERDIASRAKRFRSQGSVPPQQAVAGTQPVGGKQPAVVSTRGQGASPAPTATTEEERIARALAVAFQPRS